MPRPGFIWYHVVVNTRGSWLPGDPRGFRNSSHRIHSGGDYRNRPPKEEHAGLLRYNQRRASSAVIFDSAARRVVGEGMLRSMKRNHDRCLALAIGKVHTHMLIECQNSRSAIKRVAGRLKQASSKAASGILPGIIWAGGGTYKPIKDRTHHKKVFEYIIQHAKEGAWIWDYRCEK
jgi:hypothetical protein